LHDVVFIIIIIISRFKDELFTSKWGHDMDIIWYIYNKWWDRFRKWGDVVWENIVGCRCIFVRNNRIEIDIYWDYILIIE
jgi:hypothetical protein